MTRPAFPATLSDQASGIWGNRFGKTNAVLRDSALLGFALVTSMAFLARAFGLMRSFELWVDEMVYTNLSNSVSHGQLPNISGAPFFLHPPGAFLIDGAVIKIFGISGTNMDIAYDLRWVSAVLGAVTVGLAYLLMRRLTNTSTGWVCAVLLAFDPFVLRNNSRVFLETPATLFIVAGYLLLIDQLQAAHARFSTSRLVVIGLLFGYGVLTKDIFTLMAIIPVILAGWWRETLPWRTVLIIVCTSVVPYVIYLIVVSASGYARLWFHAKQMGLERMIGLQQTTGFNAPHSPSLISRLAGEISQYGTSYILLILCPIVAVVATQSRSPARRFIGLCALVMGLFGIYTAVFGTFEEQYGYGVMVASVLCVGIAFDEIVRRWPAQKSKLLIFGLVLTVLTVALGVRAEVTPDDGFLQVRSWVQAHLPATAHVGVTNSTAQWAFANDPRFGVWPSSRSMLQHKADYILTESLPTSEGYGYARTPMLEWLEGNAKPVFEFSGPTSGHMVMWYVSPQLLQQAARDRVGS